MLRAMWTFVQPWREFWKGDAGTGASGPARRAEGGSDANPI